MAPEVPSTIAQPQTITKGLLLPEIRPEPQLFLSQGPSLIQPTPDSNNQQPFPTPEPQGYSAHSQLQLVARRRVVQSAQLRQSSPRNQPRTRKDRTCRKCGIPGCSGRKQVSLCQNKCQDCGIMSCRGRNSKCPKKSCYDGWIGVDD